MQACLMERAAAGHWLWQEGTLLMVDRASGRCTFTATSSPVALSLALYTCRLTEQLEVLT